MDIENNKEITGKHMKDNNYIFLTTKIRIDRVNKHNINEIQKLENPDLLFFALSHIRTQNRPDIMRAFEDHLELPDNINLNAHRKTNLDDNIRKTNSKSLKKELIVKKAIQILNEHWKEPIATINEYGEKRIMKIVNEHIFPYNKMAEHRRSTFKLDKPIIIDILTKFVHIFYCPNDDYLSIASKNIITPECYRKHYKNSTTDKYILPKIYSIDQAEEEYFKIDRLVKKEPSNQVRDKMIYKFKKRFNIKSDNRLETDFTIISNTHYIQNEYYSVNNNLLYLLLMAISLGDKLKKFAVKRVLCYLLYINTKDLFIEFEPVVTKEETKEEKKKTKEEVEKYIKNTIKINKKEQERNKKRKITPYSPNVYLYDIVQFKKIIIDIYDDNFNIKIKGNMLFWMTVNTALHFVQKRGLSLLDEKDFEDFLLRLPNDIVYLSSFNDFYVKYIYSYRKVTDLFDYRIELGLVKKRDMFIKEYVKNRQYPLFFKDEIVGGYRFYDDTFKVHGQLKE